MFKKEKIPSLDKGIHPGTWAGRVSPCQVTAEREYGLNLKKGLCIFCCAALLLTGCSAGGKTGVENTDEIHSPQGMEESPVLDYEVPESIPHILVDQLGYKTISKKIAVLRGDVLPAEFSVYDETTGRIVMQGEVEEKGTEDGRGQLIGYADFSQLKEPGSYYIETEETGRSYTFRIDDEIYDEVIRYMIRQFSGQSGESLLLTAKAAAEACDVIMPLMLAYELHGDIFSDDMGIAESGNNVSDLVDVLVKRMNALLAAKDLIFESGDPKAAAGYAAVMAKFSYVYKDVDPQAATVCLKLADSVWKYLEGLEDPRGAEARFMAACELYRASGQSKYHTYIKEYAEENDVIDIRLKEIFYGAVAYISTKQNVEIELCEQFMKVMMEEAEDISARSRSSSYLVWLEDGRAELMREMSVLTVVDYIIANHEYATVIENHLHYFLGRNEEAVSYVEGFGENGEGGGLFSDPDSLYEAAVFLFMLSEAAG